MKSFVVWTVCITSCLLGLRPAVAEQPQLVVVVSVDQFCQDYLVRFSDNFSDEGLFRRVFKDGAAYGNCHHQHAFTFTAPGHAVLLTGAYPNTHGIIDNDWFDRDLKGMRYCVADSFVKVVGAETGKGMSPRTLLVNTVGDQMKLANRKSKVFGVAIKDRASILMAGHMADAAFWMENNKWVTTEYYRGDLPGYLAEINTQNRFNEYHGKRWELLLPKTKYHNNGPDENDWENPTKGFKSAFPHDLAAAGSDPKVYGDQVLATPFGNDFTLLAARAIVTNEELGKDSIPDLLCVNFSSNDYVGHAYGPNSYEVEDITYRTDLQLGEFARFLDKEVGAGKWTFFLSADHAVAPIPEYAQKQKLPAVRGPLPKDRIKKEVEALLRDRLKADPQSPPIVQEVEDQQLFLLREHPALAGESFARAQRLARNWLLQQPHVAMAKTRDELMSGSGDRLHDQLRLAFHPRRSGEVLWVLNPYCIPGSSTSTKKGTTHGSPWYYDTNVPLLALGAGIQHAASMQPVSPASLASTVAILVGVNPPGGNVEQPLLDALAR